MVTLRDSFCFFLLFLVYSGGINISAYDVSQPTTFPTRRTNRRCFLNSLVVGAGASILPPVSRTLAQEEVPTSESSKISNKPFAPVQALVPAAKVKLLIDEALALAKEASDTSTTNERRQEAVAVLNDLLSGPQRFLPMVSQKASGDDIKAGKAYMQQYARQIEALPPEQKLSGLFEQSGERRQWRRLKRQEKARESANEMRAAFNYYTSQLQFGQDYVLTADKTERSRLIRKYDQLPDVTAVVTSDLDLRDLYRNEVLTAVDDARAELNYQIKQQEGDYDFSELVSLLQDAKDSCDKWFSFIADDDVKEAIAAAQTK